MNVSSNIIEADDDDDEDVTIEEERVYCLYNHHHHGINHPNNDHHHHHLSNLTNDNCDSNDESVVMTNMDRHITEQQQHGIDVTTNSNGEIYHDSFNSIQSSGISFEEKDNNDRHSQQQLQHTVHRRSSDSFTRLNSSSMMIHRPGERTMSTSIKLRQQGFTMRKSKRSFDYAVKSIRRGSNEWDGLLKPFVSDLTFRSLEYRRHHSDISFRPYTCYAAVLFVDLSNYSKITSEIAYKGAHAISTAVNAYLTKILSIVTIWGGDVIKFAGDAIIIVWEGMKEDGTMNVITAAKCSLDLQEKAGVYIIEGSTLPFRIHCGICYGVLESEIYIAPNHSNMQRYFHCVSGESLMEISELVEIAKAGEVCISNECVEYLGTLGTYKNVDDHQNCKLLTKLNLDSTIRKRIEIHVEQMLGDRLQRRNKRIEEDFIHPSVLRLLVLGGLSPTQIAQMRNLCVLFIAMTSNGSSVNWLMEVQTILDKNRCPNDDKGVHVVAAMNLYESIPESSLMGLSVCRELVGQQVGCAIGMALGQTFCGVTGCSSVACRWDITGPPAVRAARLMQYALNNNIDVAIDQSLYNESQITAAGMVLQNPNLKLKGTADPVPVYTLSPATSLSAFRFLDTLYANVHDGLVSNIVQHISCMTRRCAVVVTGAPLTGKKVVCQRAAGIANLVPYLHVSDESAGFLQLARTIATWFQYADNVDVKFVADSVLDHMEKKRWSRAHDECVMLINMALEVGMYACFLVDRIHFLDEFSLSLIRECLHDKSRCQLSFSTTKSTIVPFRRRNGSRSDNNGYHGQICFLCVHVYLYHCKSASQIVNDITRAHSSLHIPIVTVGEATTHELQALAYKLTGLYGTERWIEGSAIASGSCVGYFAERNAASRNVSSKLWKEGKPGLIEINDSLEISIPKGRYRDFVTLPVGQTFGDVAMRFSHVFDVLPPLLQTFCKVLTVASRTRFYCLPKDVMWTVLNDLIADGVENEVFNIVVDEMVEMNLLKVECIDLDNVLLFQCPALGDVAFDVSTPIQIKSIGTALIERLESLVVNDFKVKFVLANLHDLAGSEYNVKMDLWIQGYQLFLQSSKDWNIKVKQHWDEVIAEEIKALGCTHIGAVMGDEIDCQCSYKPNSLSKSITFLKEYQTPIGLGPMGLTFNVISINVCFLYGEFHGFGADRVAQVQFDLLSACRRYLQEIDVIESFLSEHGIIGDTSDITDERKIIISMTERDSSDKDVLRKASLLFDEFIPRFIEGRLQRLYILAEELREVEFPQIIQDADKTIRLAYETMISSKLASDVVHDALMIMATRNWKPRPIPECLPTLYHQTISRIRTKVLKQLAEAEMLLFSVKYQQTHFDLEVFLIVTPLLHRAQPYSGCIEI